jgi:ribosomal protein L37AE/L43A
MAALAKVKDNDQKPFFYAEVDHTNSDNIRNEKFTCNFCEKKWAHHRYHQTVSGLLLCRRCFVYMASLSPCAQKAVERFLLGNVV